MTPSKPVKPKTCKVCKASFTSPRALQIVCGYACSLAWARAKGAKASAVVLKGQRKLVKDGLERLKTLRDHIKATQASFNSMRRAQDRLAGYGCICCGVPLDWSGNKVDNGHYRSVGSAPHLRFDPRNSHAQTKKCNMWLSGRAVDYRLGLIARIGLSEVEALEADHSSKHYSIPDLIEMRAGFMAELRRLKALADYNL